MNQSGMLTTSAISATAVLPSDQPRLLQKPPPRRLSSCGKRRAATRATIDGVISSAATKSEATTKTGTASATITSGAMKLVQPAPPIERSQANSESSSDQSSSVARTASTAGSQ